MANADQKQKTILQKLSVGFTIFCVIFLALKFTGLLDPVIEFFKN